MINWELIFTYPRDKMDDTDLKERERSLKELREWEREEQREKER